MAWAASIAGGTISGMGQALMKVADQSFQKKQLEEAWALRTKYSNDLADKNFKYSSELQAQNFALKQKYYDYQLTRYAQQAGLNTPSALMASHASSNSGGASVPPTNSKGTSTLNPDSWGITFNSAGQAPKPTISDTSNPRITKGRVMVSKGAQPTAEASQDVNMSYEELNAAADRSGDQLDDETMADGMYDGTTSDSDTWSYGTASTTVSDKSEAKNINTYVQSPRLKNLLSKDSGSYIPKTRDVDSVSQYSTQSDTAPLTSHAQPINRDTASTH